MRTGVGVGLGLGVDEQGPEGEQLVSHAGLMIILEVGWFFSAACSSDGPTSVASICRVRAGVARGGAEWGRS